MADIARFVANTEIGQNFLVDRSVVDYMMARAKLKTGDRVLEIGPGKGILTRGILATPCESLYAVELDTRLKPQLEPIAAEDPRLTIFWGDAVQFDYAALPHSPTHLIANLPYHITTPLLWTLLEKLAGSGLSYIQVMIQYEVALRFIPEAQRRDRCPLGITLQAMGKTTLLRKVARTAFKPMPRVESALLEINISQNQALPKDKKWRRLLSFSFSQRRKTLVNNWVTGYKMSRETALATLEKVGLPPMARPEELDLQQWLQLARADAFDSIAAS